MRYALRSVQHNHCAVLVCEVDQWFRVEDKAKDIADLSKSHDFSLSVNLREIFFLELTGFFIDIDIIQHRTGLLGNSLPGNQIGVMLGNGDDDAVAFFEMRFTIGTGNQIQAFRGIACINYFTCALGINEFTHYFFRAIVGFRSRNSEYVRPSVRIAVMSAVIFIDRFQHRQRFLRSRTIIKIDKRPAGTDSLQYGEIIANQFNVHIILLWRRAYAVFLPKPLPAAMHQGCQQSDASKILRLCALLLLVKNHGSSDSRHPLH